MSRTRPSTIARYEERIVAYERGAAVPVRRATPREPRTGAAPPRRSRRRAPRRHSLRARIRRIIVLAALLLTVDGCASFATAMLKPSNVGFGVRSVEWLRDNGAAWLVSDVERAYYSLTAPSTGGSALKTLPTVGVAGTRLAAYAPPPIAPVITPSLPGEGVWQRTGPLVRGGPPILVTTFRPDPNYPGLVAGVAWLDASRSWLQLYPGRYEPPNGSGAGRSAEVPQQLRGRLLATFNSAFKLEDSGGGFVAMGRVYSPLRDGLATLVRLRDGTADVRAWSGGPVPGPEVEFARQNLPLIISDGRLNPNLSDGPQWGATLGNAVRVWRSGVGIDVHGDVIYAAADNQTATSLAEILRRAGAVRAMELDINSEWVTFNFYRASDAGGPTKLLPGMSRDAIRYLSPDDRDFFAVYARNG
jgi:Phosphodiester glycosidase